MRSGRIPLLLSSFIMFVLLAYSPTLAGSINVLGSVDFGPGAVPLVTVDLGGDRGFTLNFRGGLDIAASNSAAICAFPGACPPGARIPLNAFTIPEFGGSATLDGVSYILPANCVPPENCGFPRLQFAGGTVAPPFGDFTKAILTVPVGFSGTFTIDCFACPPIREELVGSATATLTLDKFDFGPGFGVAWRYDGIEYELEPIPEPTTLLLFGSTMTGLGLLARWKRRSQK